MGVVPILATAVPATTPYQAQVLKREHTGLTLWIDRARLGPILPEFRQGKETGGFKRGPFKKDSQIENACEPTGTAGHSTRHSMVPASSGMGSTSAAFPCAGW